MGGGCWAEKQSGEPSKVNTVVIFHFRPFFLACSVSNKIITPTHQMEPLQVLWLRLVECLGTFSFSNVLTDKL